MIVWRYQNNEDDPEWSEVGYYAYFDWKSKSAYEKTYNNTIINGDIYALASVFKHSPDRKVWQVSHFDNYLVEEIEDITHTNPYMLMSAVEQTINFKLVMYSKDTDSKIIRSFVTFHQCNTFGWTTDIFIPDKSEYEPIIEYNNETV